MATEIEKFIMFKRLGNLIKAFFNSIIGGAEKSNPEALLQLEKENMRKQIAEFNKGLASHAGLVEKLISRAKMLDREESELRAKTAANLKAGNRELAGQMALKLQAVDKEHDEVNLQMQDAEKRYKELVRARDVSVKTAKERMEKLTRDMDDMKVSKAMAELNEMAAGMVTEIGGSADTLNRLEEQVEEERIKAKGRARVARDQLNMGDIETHEAETKAMEEIALADFAAQAGITLDAKAEAPVVETPSTEENKTTQSAMGPDVSEG